jgi:hypothetical protein
VGLEREEMKITSFILVDDNAGPDVTLEVLTEIASAIQYQIAHDFAPLWGWEGIQVTAGTWKQGDTAIPVYIRAQSDQPGAAGYHDDNGVYVFRDGLDSLMTGPSSLSAVISHEILETLGDPGANRWADVGDGTEVAQEMSDPVESFCYPGLNDVSVSDFVTPAFFDPNGVAPFSFLDKPTKPFTAATAGGADYLIIRSVNEDGESQVTADLTSHPRASAKGHIRSRTSKRIWGSDFYIGDIRLPTLTLSLRGERPLRGG